MAYPQLTDKPGALETASAIRAGQLSAAEAVDAAILELRVTAGDFDSPPSQRR